MALVMVADPARAVALAITAGAFLSPREERRADALASSPSGGLFVAAHLLARVCVAAFTGAEPATIKVRQDCGRCRGPHGRPVLEGVSGVAVSISHASGAVAVAAAERLVGVDVEARGRELPGAALRRATLTPAEQGAIGASSEPDHEFLRIWTRKEALVKVGAASLDRLLDVDTTSSAPDSVRGFRIQEFETPGHVGAVAARAAVEVRVL